MKIRSKATLTLRAMLARRYGFGASPNKPPLCHLWPQRHCLPLSGSPKNGAKKQRPLFWNLRFSGFLNPLGCGFYHDKLFSFMEFRRTSMCFLQELDLAPPSA